MNLLPEENKILFKKYYLRRLFAVFAVLIFSIIVAGTIVLIPMYSLILSYKSDLNGEPAAHSKKDAETSESPPAGQASAAALEIKKLNNRLSFVEKMSEAKGLNPIFKNILNKKNPGVKITYFSYEKGEEDGKISLTGKAETRDDLVIFESRLKKELGDNKVVSPVSNLIKEKDLNFSLSLYVQNEK